MEEFSNRRSTQRNGVHQSRPVAQPSGRLKQVLVIIGIIVAILIVAGGVFWWFKNRTQSGAIEKNKYQAVFLTNNQVYFGNIKSITPSTIVLQNIYYLTPNQTTQTGTTKDNQQLSLVKLGQEIHGPEDTMVIDRHQVLFWENLKDDGKVVQAIKQNKSQ